MIYPPIIPAKPFYMIRHGQTTANKKGVFSGSHDVPLTELGRQQASSAQAIFEKIKIKPEPIYTSHLSRSINTAKIINANLDIPMMHSETFAEQNFGDWEGCSIEDIRPKLYSGQNPPNGETLPVFINRAKEGINLALKSDKLCLIVCHGGIFRAFYNLYGKTIPPVDNCVFYKFTPINKPDFPWDVSIVGDE